MNDNVSYEHVPIWFNRFHLEIRFMEARNFLTDIGPAIHRINLPAEYKLNFVPGAEGLVFLTSATVLRDLDYIDFCV